MVMMETQIQPIDMTPGPPFVRPKEKDVVMPVPVGEPEHRSGYGRQCSPHRRRLTDRDDRERDSERLERRPFSSQFLIRRRSVRKDSIESIAPRNRRLTLLIAQLAEPGRILVLQVVGCDFLNAQDIGLVRGHCSAVDRSWTYSRGRRRR